MKSALMQQINTYISIAFVGALALGAGYLIVDVAHRDDFGMTSVVLVEVDGR